MKFKEIELPRGGARPSRLPRSATAPVLRNPESAIDCDWSNIFFFNFHAFLGNIGNNMLVTSAPGPMFFFQFWAVFGET